MKHTDFSWDMNGNTTGYNESLTNMGYITIYPIYIYIYTLNIIMNGIYIHIYPIWVLSGNGNVFF